MAENLNEDEASESENLSKDEASNITQDLVAIALREFDVQDVKGTAHREYVSDGIRVIITVSYKNGKGKAEELTQYFAHMTRRIFSEEDVDNGSINEEHMSNRMQLTIKVPYS